MNDPRAGDAAQRYIRILNELQEMGTRGFAIMLDTALPEEITCLIRAAEVIQYSIDRTKKIL